MRLHQISESTYANFNGELANIEKKIMILLMILIMILPTKPNLEEKNRRRKNVGVLILGLPFFNIRCLAPVPGSV